MSNFTDRMLYNRYTHSILSKRNLQHKLYRKWYPCPGCIIHPTTPARRKALFRAYLTRPQKSYGVYWRTHLSEYKLLLEKIQPKPNT